jgi:hypothetical protein
MRPHAIEAVTIAAFALIWVFVPTRNTYALLIPAVMAVYFIDAFAGTYRVLRRVLSHDA